MDENLEQINEEDVRDLRALISAVDFSLFQTSGTDIKTVRELDFQGSNFNQLVFNYVLSLIDTLEGVQLLCNLKRLGIYFSQHASLFNSTLKGI